ncbi:aldehyde dehydrogenase family protein [Sediminitomix flava]|nr:aldehyde dehydrogenase family protein [Sediminitomix flava]
MKKIEVINPATEKSIAKVPASVDIPSIYEKARNAQKQWAKQDLQYRIDCISRFQKELENKKDALALTLTQETGKPLWQSLNELRGAGLRIQFFIDNVEKYMQNETITQEEGLLEKIYYEPLGVIGNISAWNYPYLVGVNVFIPALLTGNAVLYKPSEYALLTGLKIESMMQDSGVPKEIFVTIIGDKEEGEKLLDLPLDGYYFTGSHKTGKYIYEKVASKMVPCQLELGGKDAVYVSENNENLAKVVEGVCEGVFYNNGQSCCAVERIYVHTSIYKQFIDLFYEYTKSWVAGDPLDNNTMLGPLTRKEQKKVLQAQLDDALFKGAQAIQLNIKDEPSSYYFPPTILANVSHEMTVMREESFGPIIGIQEVEHLEEAISLMKDTDYGLTSAIYTDEYNEAERLMEEMDTGSVYLNCCDRVSPNLPWAGRKNSGLGLTLSYHGIRSFLQTKAYHIRF